MYRIVNNNIFINRGETAVYDATIITKKGAPFILAPLNETDNYYIEFIVRPSAQDRNKELFKYILSLEDEHKFDSVTLISHDDGDWLDENPPEAGFENYMHYHYDDTTESYSYRRWDGTEWIPYSFRIMFAFPYKNINELKTGKYVYEINLYSKDTTNKIIFKKTLLDIHDFVIGGSIGE